MFAVTRRKGIEVGVIFLVTVAFIMVVMILGPFARYHHSGLDELCFLFLVLGALLFVMLMIALFKAGWESMRPMTKGWWSTDHHTKNSYPLLIAVLVFLIAVIVIIPRPGSDFSFWVFNLTTLGASLPFALYQYNNMRKFPALATATRLEPDEVDEIVERVIRKTGRSHRIGRKQAHQYGRMKRFIIEDGTEVRTSRGRGLKVKGIRTFVLVGPYNKEHGRKVNALAERLDSEFKLVNK